MLGSSVGCILGCVSAKAEAVPYVQIMEELDVAIARGTEGTASLGTGKFSAVRFTHHGPGADELVGPREVSAHEAIEWGRAHADTVLVMVCDDSGGGAWFSAGDLAPRHWVGVSLRTWPAGGLQVARRVASGLPEHMPTGGGLWAVELVSHGYVGDGASFAAAWADELGGDPSIRKVVCSSAPVRTAHTPSRTEGGFYARLVVPPVAARARVEVNADGPETAEETAAAAGSRARAAALRSLQLSKGTDAAGPLRARAERRLS